MLYFLPLLHTSTHATFSLLNALTCFQPILARRTSGHCLGTFRAVIFPDSPRDDDDDDDSNNNNNNNSDNIWTTYLEAQNQGTTENSHNSRCNIIRKVLM
jgi:hypothetical protein